jgi:hypothetical protein
MFNKFAEDHPCPDFQNGVSPKDEEYFWKQYFTNPHFMPTFSGFDLPRVDDRKLIDSMSHMNPQTDIVSRIEEPRNGSGFVNPDPMPMEFTTTVRSMNQQSELALLAAESGESVPGEKELSFDYEDEPVRRPPLVIVDGSCDFDGNYEDFAGHAQAFAGLLDDYAAQFSVIPRPPDAAPEDAEFVLESVSSEETAVYDLARAGSADPLVNMALDKLRKHKLEQQILLFHFWNSLDGGTAQGFVKAGRLVEKLRELRGILVTEKRSIASMRVAQVVAPLYDEMNDAFGKAFEAMPSPPG